MATTPTTNRHPWRHVQLAYCTTVKALERALAPHGMTLPSAQALLAIAGGPQPVTPSGLGRALALETSSVTGLVDRLVERGWVTRRRDLPDRREVRLRLTDEGQAALLAATDPWDATLTRLFASLSPAELVELTRVLGRVSEHAQRQTELNQHRT
jgi:DNA-binding MarR family transcriptional regulator